LSVLVAFIATGKDKKSHLDQEEED
jgi:hypothetical protein